MTDKRWYVRTQGRILGPFDVQQLRSLQQRGHFRRFHEVSEDRRSWAPAASLAELFPPTAPNGDPVGPVGTSAGSPTATPAAPAEWLYVDDQGAQQGPMPFEQLRDLWRRGTITGSTLVWHAGLTEWVAAATVSGLAPSAGARSGTLPVPVDGFAITAFVLGLLWLFGVGSIMAIVFGSMARARIRQARGRLGGKGLAVTGVVLGIVQLVLMLIAVVVFAGGFLAPGR